MTSFLGTLYHKTLTFHRKKLRLTAVNHVDWQGSPKLMVFKFLQAVVQIPINKMCPLPNSSEKNEHLDNILLKYGQNTFSWKCWLWLVRTIIRYVSYLRHGEQDHSISHTKLTCRSPCKTWYKKLNFGKSTNKTPNLVDGHIYLAV